jgi:integrase
MGVRKKTRIKGLWVTGGGHYHAKLWHNGKAKWVPLGTDYAEAKRKLNAHKAGEPIPSRVNLAEATADWLKLAVATSRDKQGQERAAMWVKTYMLKYFTGLLGSIDDDGVRGYKLWLQKQKVGTGTLSANTVARILSDLRAFLNWAADSGRIERSPFPKRVMPSIPESLPKGFTDEERATLISLPEPYGLALRLLLGTGLRWGEATRAQADHVREGQIEVEKTKSGKVRRVPLSEALRKEIRGRVGRLVPFSSTSNGSFAKAVKKASGIKDFHLHRTRHDYAMRWLAIGGNLAVLSEILGHADLKTTAIYAKVSESLVRAEAKRIEGLREGA